MESSVRERIKAFIRYENISIRAFERKCGLSNGYINSIEQTIMPNKLKIISLHFPKLNKSWLLTGEGEMLLGGINKDTNGALKASDIPFFANLPVTCGRNTIYPDILKETSDGYINIPFVKTAEYCFPVVGMSMEPTINEGEIVGVRHVETYETCNPDRVYLITTRDNERMIKRIVKYDKEHGKVRLCSDNPRYEPFDVAEDMILDIYKVVWHIKFETL